MVRTRYGTAQALAGRVGITGSAFSRGVAAGTLSTEALLRLAAETGTPASELLRLAKKEHVAVLIESLYGKAVAAPTSGDARVLAELWSGLPPNLQQALLVVMKQLPKAPSVKRKSA